MSLSNLPVAVASLNLEDNQSEMEDSILSKLPPRWVSLVVLPFGFPVVENPEQELARWARRLGSFLIGGFTRDKKRVAVILSPKGHRIGQYEQTHCLPGESFRLGNTLAPIEMPLGRIGLSIESDIYFPEIHWSLAQQGADLLVHLDGQRECYDHFYSVLSPAGRAFDTNLPFLLARPTSRQTKLVHNEEFSISGTPMSGSVILDQNGATLASTGYSSGVVMANLRFDQRCFPPEPVGNMVLYGGCDLWKLYFNDSRRRFFGPLRQPYAPAPKPAYAKRRIRVAILSHRYAVQLGHPTFLSLVEEACQHRPDVIVATEMEQECRPDDPSISAAIEAALEKTRRAETWLIIGGMRIQDADLDADAGGERRASTGVLWDRKGRQVHTSRIMLYGKGNGQQVYDTDFGRIGIRLCGDVYAPELDRLFAMQGTDIVFNPSMSWGASGHVNTLLNQVRAMDNGHYVVSAHLAFSDPGQRSHVIDPTGALVAASHYYMDGVLVTDIDLDVRRGIFVPDLTQPVKTVPEDIYLKSYRNGRSHRLLPHDELFGHRRPELYDKLDYDRPNHPFTTRYNGMNTVKLSPKS